ncbi:MAG TPA: WD40 repeat domain-containing protein, partial [Chitinophagales bacterium]|nr:WD40 repeat domain-containing protein [Chitinophagales bacterium]
MTHFRSYLLLFALCLTAGFTFAPTLLAQGFYTDFGKNRVQYQDFIWSYYESENFMTYFYQGGQDIARFTVQYAEQCIGEIESRLEYPANSKIEIMLYHNLSDLKQTNIGLAIEQNNTGGVTKIIGNKIFVHFDGNYKNLERRLREGIARVLVQKMIFGNTIQEILQNAVLLNLPDWFVNGLVSYIGKDWDTNLDDRLRRGILAGEFTNFHTLTGENATFAGHALWYYISQVHGQSAIPNLLYLTRINRSVESGFLFVLGNTVKGTVQEFNNYYQNQYIAETSGKQTINPSQAIVKTTKQQQRRNVKLDEVKISPNGRHIAYTTGEIGKHIVYLYDTQTNKKKVLLRNGFKSYSLAFHDNYPLLAWDKQSQQLAIVYERRNQIKLLLYNTADETKSFSNDIVKFQQVTSIAFTNDARKLVMSAVQNGVSDIFM